MAEQRDNVECEDWAKQKPARLIWLPLKHHEQLPLHNYYLSHQKTGT
jgi:hypothetical protein